VVIPVSQKRAAVACAVLAALGALLAGCSLLGAGTSAVLSTPDPTTGGSIGVFTLAVSDCINPGAPGAAVTDVMTVDCTVAHESEAYASIVMADPVFPGAQAVADQANAGCTSQFKTFVGIDYSASQLSYNFYFPTAASWAQGDREILCLVLDRAAKTTGTLKSTAR